MVYRFRQSRYRQRMKNRLPPKNYRRIALPWKNTAIFWLTASAKVVTAENEKTAYRLKITAVWQYRPACVRLKKRYRWPPCSFRLYLNRAYICYFTDRAYIRDRTGTHVTFYVTLYVTLCLRLVPRCTRVTAIWLRTSLVWFKHIAPNMSSIQCPRRLLEIYPEIWHTCSMNPCQSVTAWGLFYFIFVPFRQFLFLFLVFESWYLGLDIWVLIFGSWYLGLDIWILIFGSWSLGLDIWVLLFGSWYLGLGKSQISGITKKTEKKISFVNGLAGTHRTRHVCTQPGSISKKRRGHLDFWAENMRNSRTS